MDYATCRLRKYQRKKDRARGKADKWERIAMLYWRYWFKVHAQHENIWEDEQ